MVFNPDMLGNEVNVVFVNQGATLGEMEIKPFGEQLNNFTGLREFGEVN